MAGSGKGAQRLLKIGLKAVGVAEYCERAEHLAASPVLVRLQARKQQWILDDCKVVAAEPKKQLWAAGQQPFLGMVLTGQVDLLAGSGMEFERVDAGDMIGLDALYDVIASWGAMARGEVRLAVFPKESFGKVVRANPELRDYLDSLYDARKKAAKEAVDFFGRW